MDTIQYTYADFKRDIRTLVFQIDGKKYDFIVGINRGGSIPAVCLSHALKIPATMIDYSTRDGSNINPKCALEFFMRIRGSKILIVDDLIDSGVSLKSLLTTANAYCDVEVATLLYNTDIKLDNKHYFGSMFSRQVEKRYFDFWWEVV